MDITTCFMCGQKSTNFHLMLDTKSKPELGISYIICQHFWFEEDVLQAATICEPCWQKVDQFHRYYQEVKLHHEQFLLGSNSVFIKQEEVEFEANEDFLENSTDIQEGEENQSDNDESKGDNEEESNQLSSEAGPVGKSLSKRKIAQQRRLALALERQKEDEFIKQHKSYYCDECPEKFETFSSIRRHMVVSHNKTYIRCCNAQYRARSVLFQHVQTVLNPEAFKCEICEKTYTLHSGYLRHKMDAHPEKDQLVFSCDRCPKTYSRETLLKRHIALHETLENEKAKCNVCGRCFQTKKALKDHIDVIHEKTTNYICEICSKPFANRRLFLEHRLCHDITEDQMKRQCPICKRWQKNPKSWKKHLSRHKAEGSHKCNQCDHVSVNSFALKVHIERRHLKNLKYVCDHCGKEYSRALTLKEHIANAHTGQPLYQCEHCDRSFFSNATMYTHRKKTHPQEYQEYIKARYGNKEAEEGIDEQQMS
ncbi:hypothetical protein RP20_CCG014247 [Aedes albopictus]|nr:hypothetical protein RP20_CCG014247 [Aedes albopictus]